MKKLLASALVATTAATVVSAGSAKAVTLGYLGTSEGVISQVNLETGEATRW